MRRRFTYLFVALLTFVVGSTLYLALRDRRAKDGGAERQPPVAFVPDDKNKGERCAANKLYLWEKVEDIEAGVVNPNCADLQSELLNAAMSGDANAACGALRRGANPNSPGYQTPHDYYEIHRPLVEAAWSGNTEVVGLLLDSGADVNQEYCCCMSCRTPLDVAVEGGHVETVKLLLARGADANHRDSIDPEWTALKRAENAGKPEIISLLRAATR